MSTVSPFLDAGLLAQGALLGLSSAASPGPFQAYLLARSIEAGPRRAAPIATVPLASDPVVTATVLFVLASLPAGFLRGVQVVGGLVVLWLAVATLRALPRADAAGPSEPTTAPRGYWRAVLVNVTNPNAWMFWSAIGGPTLAGAWRVSPTRGLGFLAAFYACLVGGNLALVLLAGAAARLGPRFARALALVSGLALLAFGGWTLAQALTTPAPPGPASSRGAAAAP